MSQTEQIRDHLEAGLPITAIEALKDYGCLRLAARVRDLRESGMDIFTETVRNNGNRYAMYTARVSK